MSTSDSAPSLTPNQILALVVLMAEARQVTNKQLKELAGFALTGEDNKKLERLGLVETDRTHRPYAHQLTDHGWHQMRTLHGSTPPKSGGSAIRSMFTLLANVHRALDRLQVSTPEFFKQTPPAVEPARAPARREVENAIREAYRSLAAAPGDWVGLADLRERLAGIDRAATDDALRALARTEGVRIIPVANTKALEPRDRAAALRIGGEDNHTLSIGRDDAIG